MMNITNTKDHTTNTDKTQLEKCKRTDISRKTQITQIRHVRPIGSFVIDLGPFKGLRKAIYRVLEIAVQGYVGHFKKLYTAIWSLLKSCVKLCTSYSMGSLFREFFVKFAGAFLEVFETIQGNISEV